MIEEFEKLIPESERLASLNISLPHCKYPVFNKELLGATARSAITVLNFCWSEFENERVYTHWSSLKELCLTNYNLDQIDPRLFELFPKLKHLNIYFDTGSEKAKMRKNYKLGQSLTGASNLISLHIHNCRFNQLEENDFHAMVKLKQLKIQVDSVDSVKKLACLRELENLDLSGSRSLHTIGPDTFSYFAKLKQLNLSNCEIDEIDPQAFDQLPQLNELDVSNNIMEKLKLKRVIPKILNLDENHDLDLVWIIDKSDNSTSFIEKLSMRECYGEARTHFVTQARRLTGLVKELCIGQGLEMGLRRFMNLTKLEISVLNLDGLQNEQFKHLSFLDDLFLDFYEFNNGKQFF
jgi:Leucine-rich repeat (LRR) protein